MFDDHQLPHIVDQIVMISFQRFKCETSVAFFVFVFSYGAVVAGIPVQMFADSVAHLVVGLTDVEVTAIVASCFVHCNGVFATSFRHHFAPLAVAIFVPFVGHWPGNVSNFHRPIINCRESNVGFFGDMLDFVIAYFTDEWDFQHYFVVIQPFPFLSNFSWLGLFSGCFVQRCSLYFYWKPVCCELVPDFVQVFFGINICTA